MVRYGFDDHHSPIFRPDDWERRQLLAFPISSRHALRVLLAASPTTVPAPPPQLRGPAHLTHRTQMTHMAAHLPYGEGMEAQGPVAEGGGTACQGAHLTHLSQIQAYLSDGKGMYSYSYTPYEEGGRAGGKCAARYHNLYTQTFRTVLGWIYIQSVCWAGATCQSPEPHYHSSRTAPFPHALF